MKIAILGAGNAGCAVAADLTIKGHEVTLIKTSNAMHNDNFDYLLENDGKISLHEGDDIKETKIKEVTRDISKIRGKELIIVYIQTNYHEELIKRMSEYLEDGQIVLFNPGYLATAYMLKHINNKKIIIVEAESSFIDCRILKPGYIKAGFRNVRNPLGVYPANKTEYVKNKLSSLGIPFEYVSTIEAALHNPNLIVHTVGAIMSIPRIEKTNGEYCMYHEVWTPSVWNILEKLDSEKMDIIEKLGFKRLSYVEACKYRNSLDDTRDAKEVFFWYANMPTRAKGPVTVDSRYITEDVSEGLVMLEALGKQLHVETPICTALIEMASAALKRNFREKGRTIERLESDNIKKILEDSRNNK